MSTYYRIGEVVVDGASLDLSAADRALRGAWALDGEAVEIDPDLAAPILARRIEAERDRRLAAGFDYDFGDARGVHRIGTTAADQEGWALVKALADAAMQAGNGTLEIAIRTDTGNVTIQAQEWPAIQLAAAAFGQPIWQASWALKDSLPTTSAACLAFDETDDQHWTA